MNIFLLIGQSNMAGRAEITNSEKGVINNCFLLNSDNKWEPAENPLNKYSTVRKELSMQQLGPGFSFAEKMIENGINPVGLVVNALGGSAIAEWYKTEKCYLDCIERTKHAIKTGVLRGILWHQGESDRDDKNYIDKLAELASNLRMDLELPKVPFIAGQIFDGENFNKKITEIKNYIPFSDFVSAQGLTTFDGTHFDTRSTIILGNRYAEKMINFLSTLQIIQKHGTLIN